MEPEGPLQHEQVTATSVSIQSQLNPVHTPISYFLKIHLNTFSPAPFSKFLHNLYLKCE
jgi:hypothetical protein